MKKLDLSIIGGTLLILAGALYLLDSLGVIAGGAAMLWTLLFGVGGLYGVYVGFIDRENNWWATIPGFLGMGIAATISVSTYLPRVPGGISGSFVLIALGLSFWILYLWKREFWWALIPAGVMTTTAAMTAFSDFVQDEGLAGIFFLGMALTFALIYVLPTDRERMTWALIPAGILGLVGVLLTAAAIDIYNYIWPVILIFFGGYIVVRALRPKREKEQPTE